MAKKKKLDPVDLVFDGVMLASLAYILIHSTHPKDAARMMLIAAIISTVLWAAGSVLKTRGPRAIFGLLFIMVFLWAGPILEHVIFNTYPSSTTLSWYFTYFIVTSILRVALPGRPLLSKKKTAK